MTLDDDSNKGRLQKQSDFYHFAFRPCRKESDTNILYFFGYSTISLALFDRAVRLLHHPVCWPHCVACWLDKTLMETPGGLERPLGGGGNYT